MGRMINAEFSPSDIARIRKKIERLSFRDRLNVYQGATKEAALEVENRIKLNISGKLLKVRSGALRNSIQSRVLVNNDGIVGIVGSGVRSGKRTAYADIHESGGTIRPKRAKFLTIPTSHAQTPAGVTRFSARAVFEGRTQYDSAFIKRGVIFGVNKAAKSITPLFILKREVTVRASGYLSKSLAQSTKKIMQILRTNVQRVLKNGT
jgi:hypothetical protein